MRFPLLLIAPALALVFAAAPHAASAAEFSAPQKDEIGTIVRDYLREHPEVVAEAIVELQKREREREARQQAQTLAETAALFVDSPNQAVVGNPTGKITLVEFFDYNCGYCKHALGDVARLVKDNKELRIVLRDWPIISPASRDVALVEAAVRRLLPPEKFFDYHQKLLGAKGQVGAVQAVSLAKDMGLDPARVQKEAADPELAKGLDETQRIALDLGQNGTPFWVIGDEVTVGAVGYDQLRAKIENMARCGKAACG